jgi:hypothetical protein
LGQNTRKGREKWRRFFASFFLQELVAMIVFGVLAGMLSSWISAGAENCRLFGAICILRTDALPRQARDKHTEKSQKEDVCARRQSLRAALPAADGLLSRGEATVLLVRFYPKIPSFCQDRLGTSIGKAALKNDDQPFSCLQFLRAKRFPYEVRKRVRTFYAHLYENKTVFDEKEILSQLPAGTSIQ